MAMCAIGILPHNRLSMKPVVPHNAEYIHHQNPSIGVRMREFVFGIEDGMVSTLGSVTGIAAATQDHFTVVLTGLIVVAVESISMAVGSYLSSKSQLAIDERKLQEEGAEIADFPEEEKQELVEMYVHDGWPRALATNMAHAAAKNKGLFLQEMAYRELKIIPENLAEPFKNGVIMGASYILGGAIPLLPYFFFSIGSAIVISIMVTLAGLFAVGVFTTKYSHRAWWKAGFEMLLLASAAALVGYAVGQAVERWWLKR